MENLAAWFIGADYAAGATATVTDVVDLGQPSRSLHAQLVLWLFAHGVMVLYTPLGGSWLNMAESIQHILIRRALSGQNPQAPQQIIAWLEAAANVWNQNPTSFH